MLAEKRCKLKWSDDPRNTRWSKGKIYFSSPFNPRARDPSAVCVVRRPRRVWVSYAATNGVESRPRSGEERGGKEGVCPSGKKR